IASADQTPSDTDAAIGSVPQKKQKKSCEKWERIKNLFRKRRQLDKTAMKLSTAISLSWNNLLSKKGRTLLTSIAGSIGIIGIILVLSLSTGAKLYINNLEESALSSYPLTVSKSSLDINSILSTLMGSGNSSDDFDENVITTEKVLGGILSNFSSLISENDLQSLKKYIDTNFDSELADVKYDYGTVFNAFVEDPSNEKKQDEDDRVYMKVNPYSEMMYAVFDTFMEDPTFKNIIDMIMGDKIEIMGMSMDFNTLLGYLTTFVGESWAEMSSNQELLDHQYELVGNSKWPAKANEVVIVVNENNALLDYELFMLGLKSTDEVLSAILGGNFASASYEVDNLIGREMKIMTNADYLIDNGDGTWTMHDRSDLHMNFIDEHAMTFADGTDTVKVVGVVRPRKGVVATSINGVVGYTSKLTDAMHEHTRNHPAVQKMLELYREAVSDRADYYESPIYYSYTYNTGSKNVVRECKPNDPIFLDSDKAQSILGNNGSDDEENESLLKAAVHMDLMRQLGFVNDDYLVSINFYCYSFEAKDQIVDFLEQYEKDTKKTIKYGDSLSSMMAFVNTMANTITGVLVAFAAISLVVSTIMIAIIIYTSVLERRKEIGVLRSIGARKKDISRVFLAESAILGGYSGVIGIIFSSIISAIGSVILSKIFNINGLMSVQWWHCVMMFLISVFLSMLAGFVPARIASKKDPAIALRSE
ncbi:MAG: ABC transporter permease, partial [Bacteroides sp.]|nr:ABC transporter permease [Bacteroides sp.]